MYLGGKSVLHLVNGDKKFETACFLEADSTSGIWEEFLCNSVTPYVGFPHMIAVEKGPQFTSVAWTN